uniref:Uncharacterized protein n=1 Tax=Timema poppense TaxID=170557 RepID=A0A7R9D1V6_TIMPO|nr:unnamed protein product [Timema poppensis]
MTENMPASQSQFSIESPRNTSSKTVTFSEDVKKQKPNTDMDSDSDWSISSDESAAKIKISTEDQTTALLDVGGGPTIHLSTKQSAKIAEISKSIEHQLSLTRRKPVGGVESMFSEERTENNINIANRPIPKPRQQLQLSDWDLEDFPSS